MSSSDSNDVSVASTQDRERISAAHCGGAGPCLIYFGFSALGQREHREVSERQRDLARWLIDHGVDAVVGTHPHCIQPFDSYHGRPIIYSLGNLVFDGAPTVPSWNRGELLEIDLGEPGSRPRSFRLVPVQLDARGFPPLVETDENQESEKSFATAGAAFSRNRVQGASKNR